MNHNTFLRLSHDLDRRFLHLNPCTIGQYDLRKDLIKYIPVLFTGRHIVRRMCEKSVS